MTDKNKEKRNEYNKGYEKGVKDTQKKETDKFKDLPKTKTSKDNKNNVRHG